jgi:hypothetical protein
MPYGSFNLASAQPSNESLGVVADGCRQEVQHRRSTALTRASVEPISRASQLAVSEVRVRFPVETNVR